MRLDKNLINQFTIKNYENIFNALVDTKRDKYNSIIKIPMGVDGIDYSNIHRNINQFASVFCKRATSGKYLFSPFREIQIPKAPYSKYEFKLAKSKGKLRTLSICTINDTIFQKMLYNAIYDYTESKYSKITNSIFGYRKGKSVKQAIEKIQTYFKDGYIYGIDGDIEKYFDMIDHERLFKKTSRFYGNNPLVIKYLYRFIHVGRVPIENKKLITEYYNKKPTVEKRVRGIPQGGVVSGLLANIYLFNFDKYVNNNLSKLFDIKYIRYADDFIILCKNKEIISSLYKKIHAYFVREKLNLHPIDNSAIDGSKPNNNKTKAINLETQHYVEFLGYRISQKFLAIKKDNIKKFKKTISHILELGNKQNLELNKIYYKINAKILGNWIFTPGYFAPCKVCGKPQKPQSWIGFFINITDLRQLKSLDRWVRSQLHKYYYMKNKERLPKKYFRKPVLCDNKTYYNYNIVSLFDEACIIKNYFKKNPELKFCECEIYSPIEFGYI